MTIRANVPPPIPEGEMRARERGRGGVRPDEMGDPASWGFFGRPPTQALSVIGRPGLGYDILLLQREPDQSRSRHAG